MKEGATSREGNGNDTGFRWWMAAVIVPIVIALIGRCPGSPERREQVQTPRGALRLIQAVEAGQRVDSSMIEPASAPTSDGDYPSDFERDLFGTCFVEALPRGFVITWENVGACP